MLPAIRAFWLIGLLVGTIARISAAAELIELSPRWDARQIARITVNFEAGGNAAVRLEAEAAATAGKEEQLPISVQASLQYDERRLATGPGPAAEGALLAARYYNQAEAVIKVDQGGVAPRLSEQRRVIAVAQIAGRPVLFAPSGPMPRDELDLIDVVGNSTLIDQLLPTKPVAQGDSWMQTAALMGGLLTLDAVSACEVQSVLEEFNSSFAKIRLSGIVNGTSDGTPTQQEVRGVYLFDRRWGRITRLNLAVREQRSIGNATPGLDAVAKLQIQVEPVESSPGLADEAVGSLTARPLELLYDSPQLGFRAEHDRNWYITSEGHETVTLRRVDRGDLIAHCTIASLPPKSAGRQTSLDQFQQDIIFSLGKSFGELVSARQWTSSRGHFCYEVIARGLVEEVPIEWHYFLIAQEAGHRVSLAVTIERPMIERLGQADRQLVESIELFAPRPKTAQTPSAPGQAVR
jgi:hypothetical protein